MNLANKLTIIRIFLVPVFLIFITIKDVPYGNTIATAIFILAALTDKLDGYIARSRNQITRFGKFMDPLADKLLVTAALVSLVEFHVIPTWVAMVIIAREFAVTGDRKSTRLNSSHANISYAVFCLKKKHLWNFSSFAISSGTTTTTPTLHLPHSYS